mgnify:CR=1 FL=1
MSAAARRWAFAVLLAASGAAAAPPGRTVEEWRHTIEPGDTLIGLTTQYLREGIGWRRLQAYNRVADPLRLRPGRTLRAPLAWVREDPAPAEAVRVTDPVTLMRQGQANPLSPGDRVQAGDVLEAGPGGAATLRFGDGTRALVRPDTRVELERAVRLGPEGPHATGLHLDQGSIDTVVPPSPRSPPRYDIRTRTVNLGVRGTEFRAHAEAGTAVTRVEVLEGRVALGERQVVAAGFGAVADPGGGLPAPRALLPAPSLSGLPERVDRVPLRFAWTPQPGAQAYRVQVLDPQDDEHLLLDGRVGTPLAQWPDLPDGQYRLAVRSIDATGLEGETARWNFVLKARPEPPFLSGPLDGARVYGAQVGFGWTRSAAAARYRFQLADEPTFARPMADRPGLDTTEQVLDLPPGRYHWRVASIRLDGDQGPYSDAQAFELREIPPSPQLQAPEASKEGMVVRWRAREGARYRYQLARDESFDTLLLDATTDEPQASLGKLSAGRYHLRVQTIDADGYAGPFGPAQRIEVPRSAGWLLLPLLLLLLL